MVNDDRSMGTIRLPPTIARNAETFVTRLVDVALGYGYEAF